MSLGELQQAIAALVCDGRALRDFTRDPRAWAQARGLREEEVRLLVGVQPAAMHSFQAIQARDRASFFEAILPLTLRRRGSTWSVDYFAQHPYGEDDLLVEARRFATFLDEDGDDEAAALLARYEVAKFDLLSDAPFEPASPLPMIHAESRRLAPGLRVVASQVHIPTLDADPLAQVSDDPGAVLLRRDADGVTAVWLTGALAALLIVIARDDRHAIHSQLRTPEGEAACHALVAEGVIR